MKNNAVRGAARCFEKIYGKAPQLCCFAPGRVNLIGEHTDYNGGYVFPCAIDPGIYCAAAKRTDRLLRFYSSDFPDEGIIEYKIDDLRLKKLWADYPVGVIKALAAFGYDLPSGADLFFVGDLPDGAGLSSSAALEVVTAAALRELFSIPVTNQETALIGQFAENRFIGVNCGIMDQFASAMGKAGHAILLDANTLAYKHAPLGDAAIVIVNSGVKHSLASSAYNQRRRECESAAAALKIPYLCCMGVDEFECKKKQITDEICQKRAKHAIYENQRVIDAADALEKGDLQLFGKLMNDSHASLRDDYEVSCEELDFLAGKAQLIPGVYGARMTGGGFGGCTVNLMEKKTVNEFISVIGSLYEGRFGIKAEIYSVSAANGAGICEMWGEGLCRNRRYPA